MDFVTQFLAKSIRAYGYEAKINFEIFEADSSISILLIDLGYDVSGPIDDPLQNVRAYWGSPSTLPCVAIITD